MNFLFFFILATIFFVWIFRFAMPFFDWFFGDGLPKEKIKEEYLPYVKNNYLMTEAEHNFLKILQQVVQDRYYIVPQVLLSKIIRVNRYERHAYTYLNKIDRKTVDFVLFEKTTFSPYLVIELDDESHQLPDREVRDKFVDQIMQKVGLRIKHIKTSYTYNVEEISYLIGFTKSTLVVPLAHENSK